jgi:hypothetical protein
VVPINVHFYTDKRPPVVKSKNKQIIIDFLKDLKNKGIKNIFYGNKIINKRHYDKVKKIFDEKKWYERLFSKSNFNFKETENYYILNDDETTIINDKLISILEEELKKLNDGRRRSKKRSKKRSKRKY